MLKSLPTPSLSLSRACATFWRRLRAVFDTFATIVKPSLATTPFQNLSEFCKISWYLFWNFALEKFQNSKVWTLTVLITARESSCERSFFMNCSVYYDQHSSSLVTWSQTSQWSCSTFEVAWLQQALWQYNTSYDLPPRISQLSSLTAEFALFASICSW